jgi:phage tail-like protein
MPDSTQKHFLNYVTANRFYVEIEGNITSSFTECSGLGAKVKRETIFEGGLNYQQRVILGQTEFSDVTLKRGITDDMSFWNWVVQTIGAEQQSNSKFGLKVSGAVDGVGGGSAEFDGRSLSFNRDTGRPSRRRNVNILLFNQAGETMQCWTLIAAVPVGWKAPALQANGNTLAIEELTLAYEGLNVTKSSKGGATYLSPSRDQSGFHPSH